MIDPEIKLRAIRQTPLPDERKGLLGDLELAYQNGDINTPDYLTACADVARGKQMTYWNRRIEVCADHRQ